VWEGYRKGFRKSRQFRAIEDGDSGAETVIGSVVGLGIEEHEVFDGVIVLISVDMVDDAVFDLCGADVIFEDFSCDSAALAVGTRFRCSNEGGVAFGAAEVMDGVSDAGAVFREEDAALIARDDQGAVVGGIDVISAEDFVDGLACDVVSGSDRGDGFEVIAESGYDSGVFRGLDFAIHSVGSFR